jgi:hypothetical protein
VRIGPMYITACRSLSSGSGSGALGRVVWNGEKIRPRG